jgi:hypothetical protein
MPADQFLTGMRRLGNKPQAARLTHIIAILNRAQSMRFRLVYLRIRIILEKTGHTHQSLPCPLPTKLPLDCYNPQGIANVKHTYHVHIFADLNFQVPPGSWQSSLTLSAAEAVVTQFNGFSTV